MDVFKEQIVRKLPSRNEKISKILIIISAVALAFMCFSFTFGGALTMIGILLAGGALYGGYYLITNFDVEYEYILTNGEMDFDKIIAQRNRKRLCTIHINTAVDFGVADGSENTDGVDTYVSATANDSELKDYFIRLNDKNLGDTVVYFNPNEEMVELIKPYLPRNIRK